MAKKMNINIPGITKQAIPEDMIDPAKVNPKVNSEKESTTETPDNDFPDFGTPQLRYMQTRPGLAPVRGTPKSAGIDIFVPEDFPETVIEPGQRAKIPTGLHFLIPPGMALVAMNKSSVGHISVNMGLDKTAELIDEDYEGEVHICVANNGALPYIIQPNEKLMQLVLIPVVYGKLLKTKPETMEKLYKSRGGKRGKGGFGSTG